MNAAYVKIGDSYYAPGHSKAKALAKSVGGLGTAKPKPNEIRTLDRKPASRKRIGGSVLVIVSFVPFCLRATDDDNRGSGCYKKMRDTIAKLLGIDDADPRVKWEYHPPVITRGATGTQVLVSLI